MIWGAPPLYAVAVLAVALWLAFRVDRRFGELPSRLHPVVWMGNYLQLAGSVSVRCGPAAAFVAGALFWWLGVLVAGGVAFVLQWCLLQQVAQAVSAPLNLSVLLAVGLFALTVLLLKAMFSWRMLHSETAAVEAALQQSLQAGRERLSWLVSRDTSQLTERQVRESAIESLAENLNDSVVAPVFWFVLFGLPGAAAYRFANTADAMWGYPGVYKGRDWAWAGKWAARADDVLSWLPARLTALLIALVAGPGLLRRLLAEAGKTPSPNSGWPMAAMALALDVSLAKPGVYVLHPQGRPATEKDTVLAQKYASKVVKTLMGSAWLAMVLIALVLVP